MNNDGAINQGVNDEIKLKKAETFAHFTYIDSEQTIMVVDLQGVNFTLSDPEIASKNTYDESSNKMYFCSGNWGEEAIRKFLKAHACNEWCKYFGKKQGE